MVMTKKFSGFAASGQPEIGDTEVGLKGGANTIFTQQWTFYPPGNTASRPVSPVTGPLRFNTQLNEYEYWDGAKWVQLLSPELLTLLASHIAGQGASLIGLQNQTGVTNKTVQNLANEAIIVASAQTSLTNGVVLTAGSGITLTPSTGVLTVSSTGGSGATAVQVQRAAFNIGLDSGVADAYRVTLSPPISGTPTNGMLLGFVPLNSNATQSATISVDGGATSHYISAYGLNNLQPFEVEQGKFQTFYFDSDFNLWIHTNPGYLFPIPSIISFGQNYFDDGSGTDTNGSITFTAGTVISGSSQIISFATPTSNTGSYTITVNDLNGTTVYPVYNLDGSPLFANQILAFTPYAFMLSANLSVGGYFLAILNPSLPYNLNFQSILDTSSSTTDYTGDTSNLVAAYVDGMNFLFKPATTNTTTSPTINLTPTGGSPLGAINIVGPLGVIAAGNLIAGNWYQLTYNGSTNKFQTLVSPAGTGTVNPGTANHLAYYATSTNAVSSLASATAAVLTTVSGVPTWANQLSLALGGTNASLTASNGGIFYSTASAGAILAGTATAGLALLSGASTTPSWSTSPPITQLAPQLFTAGTTAFTPNTNTVYIAYEIGSGGGAGGGGDNSASTRGSGSGGGEGSKARGFLTRAQAIGAGTQMQIVVGAGGTAGTAGANDGNTGSISTLKQNNGAGSTIVSCPGGVGGLGMTATGGPKFALGALGGAAPTISIGTALEAIPGNPGGIGLSGNVTGTILAMSGYGAFSADGAGGRSLGDGGSAGETATGYRAGGSGASSFSSNFSGGPGAPGFCIITEYISV